MKDDEIVNRKSDHIQINLEKNVNSALDNGLNNYRFVHNALPEISLNAVDTGQELFGRQVRFPLLISSMTGGTERAAEINRRLATAAQKYGLAMGVGSQRAAIIQPDLAKTFQVREFAPSILLFANLGAVQLNYGFGVDECKRAIEMIDADGLILHLNSLQEAIQPNGDTNFSALLQKIGKVTNAISHPIIVKEVGWGISAQVAKSLFEVGVAGVDISGAGGTSWSQVERFRLKSARDIRVAEAFIGWGLTTAQSLLEVYGLHIPAKIFASGGIKDGMDLARAIALGADLAGMAGSLLKKADLSQDELEEEIEVAERIFRIAMFSTGSLTLSDFRKSKIYKVDQ